MIKAVAGDEWLVARKARLRVGRCVTISAIGAMELETFQWVASYQLVHDADARDFGMRVELSQLRTVCADGEVRSWELLAIN
jgi:hypothetical protein